jgi:hypothetical protein
MSAAMKGKRSEERPLVAAAERLDDAMSAYDRTAHGFLRQKLDSRKNLAKAAEAMNEVLRHEEKLSSEVGALIGAITHARDQQQHKAKEVHTRALEVLRRTEQVEPLLVQYQALAQAVSDLVDRAANLGGAAGLDAILEAVEELGGRARAFATEAQSQEFGDLAAEGHALREQLLAIKRHVGKQQKN